MANFAPSMFAGHSMLCPYSHKGEASLERWPGLKPVLIFAACPPHECGGFHRGKRKAR